MGDLEAAEIVLGGAKMVGSAVKGAVANRAGLELAIAFSGAELGASAHRRQSLADAIAYDDGPILRKAGNKAGAAVLRPIGWGTCKEFKPPAQDDKVSRKSIAAAAFVSIATDPLADLRDVGRDLEKLALT